MKLKKESIEIKDCEMGTKSELEHNDSQDNVSTASTNQSTLHGCQLNIMPAEQITSNGQEKVVIKQEVFELFSTDESIPQNTYSISEDCIITSTNQSNSSESQEFKMSSEENISSFKEEVSVKHEVIEVFLVDESVPQNINSMSDNCMRASTDKSNSSESPEFEISPEENIPSHKEKASIKQETFEMFFNNESIPQNTYSKSEDCIITSISKSNSSENQEHRIFSEENVPSSEEKVSVKQEAIEVFIHYESVPQNACSKSEDCMEASTSKSNSSESQEIRISSEGNICSYKEEEVTKQEESEVCMAEVSNPPDSVEGLLITKPMNSNESHQHETPPKENILPEIPNEILDIEDNKNHRQNIHYSSDSSDSESDSSSSWDEFYDKLHKDVVPTKLPTLKTKGELLIEDLPPVEDLDINVDEKELQKIGSVLHSVISKEHNEYLVVVESEGESNPIDVDSVLFLAADKPLGKVYDVFASVSKPNYTVRFNKAEDIFDKGITAGQDVYYIPENEELTHYVLVDVLKLQKGSDASWKDNNEPPEDHIDYSDDEIEYFATKKEEAKNRQNDRNWNDGEEEDMVPNKMERRHAAPKKVRKLRKARLSRNRFRPPAPNVSRSSSQAFGSTPPSPNIFGIKRNDNSPQPFRFIASNNNRPAFSSSSFPQSSTTASQVFRFSSHNNMTPPQTFGPLPQSRMPPPIATFPPSSVPYQSFTVPPNSNVASPNFAPPHYTGVQQNPSSLMAAPQNNIPLQQQLLMQSQQPVRSFLSHPPPNYNSNQNTRPFLHQIQSFAQPMFGAPPAVRPTMQNIFNQSSSVNQVFSPLVSNFPSTSFSGNLNMTPTNSNGYQGQSSGIMQSNSTNSFLFPQMSPPINTQHNNVYPQITQPVFLPNQSPCPTPPPFVPCPTPPPFVPCQTPPPSVINQQQGFSVLSSPRPPSQTPPPTFPPFAFTLPTVRSPMPPQNFPYI